MHQISRSAYVPYTAEQMYDLITDIRKYPEFLPWCTDVVVHKADTEEQDATLKVQKGFFRHALRTRNQLKPNESVVIHLVDGPFKQFEARWTITTDADGVRISYVMNFEVSNPMMAALAAPFFDQIAGEMVEVFNKRAKHLYG
ncbi:MAG: type II toxin-antitoxin system RatA family toxin [Pseudomonadota bacterium]